MPTHYREPGQPWSLCGRTDGTATADLGAVSCERCQVAALAPEVATPVVLASEL